VAEPPQNPTEEKIDDIRRQLSDLEHGGELSRLFRKVLDATDNTMTITDPNLPDNPLVYVNKEFENLTGYSYDEAVGRNCRFLQADDRDQDGVHELREAIREGRNAQVVLRNYRKNGEMFWNELYLTAVRDDQGKVIYFFGVQNDISEVTELHRREIEQRAVKKSEKELRSTFELSGMGQSQADLDGTITRANRKFCEMLGYRENELVGMSFLELTHPDDREGNKLELKPILDRQVDEAMFEKRYLRKDGGFIWARVTTTLLTVDDEPPRFLAAIQDITEQRRARETVERLNETLERRVSERTNDVRRLASALTLAENRERHRIAQLLHDDLQQEIFAVQYALRGLQKQVQTLAEGASLDGSFDNINNQLKGTVRIARGLTSDLSPPVLKEEGFGEALSWLARRAKEQYGLKVVLDIPQGLSVPHEALRVLLLSLIRELFLNVIKHAETTQVKVQLRQSDTSFVIDVIDEGQGFVYDKDKVVSESTGFGLYSIGERLRLFGGSLDISSTLGEGTQVTIIVPTQSFTLGE